MNHDVRQTQVQIPFFFPTHDFGNFYKLLRISLSLSPDGDNNIHIIVKMNLDRYK